MKSDIVKEYAELNELIGKKLDAIASELIDMSDTWGEAVDGLEYLDDPHMLTSELHSRLYDRMKKQANRQ
ncbi:hypothetical protein [Lacticaseibacillus kribbianus]|uniref:hypothetical protein n=1 Tax=Lacticaseibacillus kribbianus TaxID=2926292 RepID=UPI001CD22737|nr:hypothetical protein [Lacticaseibacillus kribbianus]